MHDYDKIAKAIEFINKEVSNQPSLEEIAAHIHLSPYHFQRLFSRWAGVSPKRYLQALTVNKAKYLLQSGDSVENASGTLGLSSGSRLYDHFIQLEAMTPAEYKSARADLKISYGVHDTVFGKTLIATTPRGICKISFYNSEESKDLIKELHQSWSNAEIIEEPSVTESLAKDLFSKQCDAATKPLSLLVKGTNFQINVWRALLDIKTGRLSSYSDIACKIGSPNAVRAVGTAVGANPIGYLIPCHRVIRQDGNLGGYRWGLYRKQAMLAYELAPKI